MKVKVNPTGTHEHRGKVKIRLDLYPGAKNKRLHALHYVKHPDREYTKAELEDEALRALVPTHKALNPCLCRFVTVDEDITPDELKKLMRQTFDKNTLRILEDALCRDDGLRTVQIVMQGKRGRGSRVRSFSKAKRDKLNACLADVEVVV